MARPHVTLNLALSADGKISTHAGLPSGWTSREDQRRFHELRRGMDAILVGRGTLEADQMTLTVAGQEHQPLRCIASRTGNLDPSHKLFHTAGGPVHLLVSEPDASFDAAAWQARGACVHAGTLEGFLTTLRSGHGVERLLCEGGGALVRALAELDAIDTIQLCWAGHTLFGGTNAPTLSGLPGDHLPASLGFKLASVEPSSALGECFITYQRMR